MAFQRHLVDVATRKVGQDHGYYPRLVRLWSCADAIPVGGIRNQLADRYADANADSHANPDGDSETNITTTAIKYADTNP